MIPNASMDEVYEERIARFLELAEAAQEAANRASTNKVQETYADLARQWAHLAELAQSTLEITRRMSEQLRELEGTRRGDPLH